MRKTFCRGASFIMLVFTIMMIHSLNYDKAFAYKTDTMPSNRTGDTENCIVLSDNLNITMCVMYNGAKYGFILKYAPDVSNAVWRMDIATFRQIDIPDIPCLSVDNSLSIKIPCITYGVNSYELTMNYYLNTNDSSGLYWQVVGITPLEPDDPSPDAPLPEPDFTITLEDKDGRTIKPLNAVSGGPLAAETDNTTNVDLVNEYKELGIKYVRTHDFYGPFDMAEIYGDRTKDPLDSKSYNFENSDKHYEGITEAGCSLYLRLGDSYSNPDPPETSERVNWIEASMNVIAHYYEGKWDGYNGAFEYVEIWNEPDNSHFWPNKSLLDFFVLFDATAKRIRSQFPNIKIGGPGFTQNVNLNDDRKIVLEDFLDYIKKNNTPIDFISFHQYTSEPTEITTAVNSMKTILQEKGFEGLSMHMTEWNTDAERQGQSNDEKTDLRLNSRGAAVNTGTWIEMQNNGIDMAFFFRGNDTNIDMPLFYGLYLADGTPKKTAFAFKFFNEISYYEERLSVSMNFSEDTGESTISDIYVIAGENADGNRAVIIANISDKKYTYRLNNIQGGKSGDVVREDIISASGISDEHENIYDINDNLQGSDTMFNLPGYGVQLILLKK